MGVERIAHPFGPMTRYPTIASSNLPARAATHAAICLILCLVALPLRASVSVEKTPSDVYRQVTLLAEDVKMLRRKNRIDLPWPEVEIGASRQPRHVFQKALEILEKINSYRINIARTGGITIPRYPGRDITPNEVYSVVVRLRQELALLVKRDADEILLQDAGHLPTSETRTPSDVYRALSEVSIALDQTLGLRGITPSEVYTRSLKVLALAKFLRRSQNLPPDVQKPPRPSGRLPNHALKAVHGLLERIRQAEHNLWMKPLAPPHLPKRVITPSDVYDAMGVAMAELQSIQYRLGLERDFPDPAPQTGKTPDDVIQNTLWATRLLPLFRLDQPLRQYNRATLRKTPNDVFSVTEFILTRLQQYRRLRGVQTPPRKVQRIPGLKPQHVYGKGLEIMEKVDVLRQQLGMGPIAVPRYPLRTITPSEVFDLALRLDQELALIHQREGVRAITWNISTDIREYQDKQPSDVFLNMQRISLLLDTVLGSEGFTPDDVFREVLTIREELILISEALDESIPRTVWQDVPFRPETEPGDVLVKAREVLGLILEAKRRAGMFNLRNIAIRPESVVTPSDVFNQVRLIETELTEFKVFLGIDTLPPRPPKQEGKSPAHVLQMLEGITGALRIFLHREQA